MLLETYRECLRDFFDMPALITTLADVRSRTSARGRRSTPTRPSPFAASLLFSYVASFLYDGDAPLAERRAQALAVDQAQLRELIGDAELRELLDADSMDAIERQLQRLDAPYRARSADGVHDMLLAIGDLSAGEVLERVLDTGPPRACRTFTTAARTLSRRGAFCRCASRASRDSSRSRTRHAIETPSACCCRPGLPMRLLEPVARSAGEPDAAVRAHPRAVHGV